MNNEDRRASKRISYVCEVECEGAGLNCLATRITDLSLSGAFIDSMTCYAPGTQLRLRFHVQDELIETAAEVRYTMPRMGMGVRFHSLAPECLAALESLIEGKPLIKPMIKPATPAEQLDASENTQDGWDKQNMLLGNFAVVSMFDVIQIIENNRLSGALSVMFNSVTGEIQFNSGQIVGAFSGSTTGVEALKGLVGVTQGSFEFRKTGAHYPSTIDAPSNMSLMLDLLRAIDEEAVALS